MHFKKCLFVKNAGFLYECFCELTLYGSQAGSPYMTQSQMQHLES